MSDQPTGSSKGFLITLLAVVGGFGIFLLILTIAYLPKKPAPLGDGVRTPEERKAILAELRGKEKKASESYAWISQPDGVVQLPIERAMELTLRDLQQKRK